MKILNQISLTLVISSICLATSCIRSDNDKTNLNSDPNVNLVSENKSEAGDITAYYLVRHAEKLSDDKDPHLSKAGLKRAKELSRILKDVSYQAIYSTNYHRTKETVTGIAGIQSLQIEDYDPRDLDGFVTMLKSKYTNGEHVLIAGHSNSTPMLANKLVGSDLYEQFDEKHYDNLIIISVPEEGTPSSIQLHYGALNPE